MTEIDQALRIEAMRLARNAVRHRIRDQGQRLKDYEAKEIDALAKALLRQRQSEMITQAWANLLRSNIRNGAQKSKALKSMASAVQNSGAK